LYKYHTEAAILKTMTVYVLILQIIFVYMFHIENWVNITWATADLLICTNMNLHITMMLHCKRNWGGHCDCDCMV